MLEEKDQKLEKLLERQGISTFKYVISWLINYLFVGLKADIACILGGSQILESFFGLYLIDIVTDFALDNYVNKKLPASLLFNSYF